MHVSKYGISGTEGNIFSDGTVCFGDLTLGLYLIVQTTQSTGFYTIESFLVTVPVVENDHWVCHVDATTKTEVNPESSESSEPSELRESSGCPEPSESPKPQ